MLCNVQYSQYEFINNILLCNKYLRIKHLRTTRINKNNNINQQILRNKNTHPHL